ncbi:MAG: hypothetical protein WC624_02005 [Candidatus Margulisiibacteriota bacterium]
MIGKLGSAAFDVFGKTRTTGGPFMAGGVGGSGEKGKIRVPLIIEGIIGGRGFSCVSITSNENHDENVSVGNLSRLLGQEMVITRELALKLDLPWIRKLFSRSDIADLDFKGDHEGALNRLNACLAEEMEREKQALKSSRLFDVASIMQNQCRSAQGVYGSPTGPEEGAISVARENLVTNSKEMETVTRSSNDRFHLGLINKKDHPEFGDIRYVLTLGAGLPDDLKSLIG